ncbi:MAG: hypothetical protein JEZ02_05985 [Desulfatibacillum sp.]|nr:hypothetical protein [Desulfatibacillum sp.]
MRPIDSFVYVFLAVTLFSGFMFVKSMSRQRQLIRSLGDLSSRKSYSLKQTGAFSTGLWLLFFLASGCWTATNYAITYYQNKGFEQHRAEAPVYPGATPTNVIRMPSRDGSSKDTLTYGNYEAPATPEMVVEYFRNNTLEGGWRYEEDKQNILVVLAKEDGTRLKIVIQALPPEGAQPVCRLMYLQNG